MCENAYIFWYKYKEKESPPMTLTLTLIYFIKVTNLRNLQKILADII